MAGRGPDGKFLKGTSGNPKGPPRKKAKAQALAFSIITDKTLMITTGGKLREASLEDACEHRIFQDALGGKRAARREIYKMINRRERAIAAKSPRQNKVETKVEHIDDDSIHHVLQILDIAHPDPTLVLKAGEGVAMLLEPWAVQDALTARRAPRLSPQNIDLARRATRDPDSIRWPEAEQDA